MKHKGFYSDNHQKITFLIYLIKFKFSRFNKISNLARSTSENINLKSYKMRQEIVSKCFELFLAILRILCGLCTYSTHIYSEFFLFFFIFVCPEACVCMMSGPIPIVSLKCLVNS